MNIALTLTLIISLLFGLLLRNMAIKYTLKPIHWFVMGFCFGPLAFPFIFFAAWKKQKRYKNN